MTKHLKHLPVTIFIIGMLITIFLSWQSYLAIQEKEELLLKSESDKIVTKIKDRVDSYEQILLGGAAFIYASENITREKWRIFVERQKITENFPGIQGIGYSVVVRPNELEKHIAKIRAEGFAAYTIRPSGQRELYTPVIYLEPFNNRNKRAFGYDMFSEKVRREALQKAIDSGEATLSGKVRLVQENSIDEQAGFLMYVPVYAKGATLNTLEDRMANISGFVYAPFRAKDFMTGIMSAQDDKIWLRLYDGDKVDEKNLMHNSHPNCQKEVVSSKVATLNINNHSWTVEFKVHEEFFAPVRNYFPQTTMVGGTALSILLFFLFGSFARTQEKAERLAQKMTKELNEAKQQLEVAVLGSEEGVWDWDVTTGKIEIDRQAKTLLGYLEHELEWSIEEFSNSLHPEDKERVFGELSKFSQGTELLYKSDHRLRKKDGSYLWVLAKGKISQKDNDGKPLRMTGTLSDITWRKETELQLQKSEERFRKLFEGHRAMMYLVDPETGMLIEVNKAAADFYGYEPHELNGQHISKIHTWSLERIAEAKKNAALSPQTYFELQHRQKDGNIRDMQVHTCPIELEGKTILFSILFDITERKKIQEKLERLLDEMKALHEVKTVGFVHLKERHFAWTNEKFEQMLGYEKGELQGESARKIYFSEEEYKSYGQTIYNSLVETGTFTGELRHVRKDGTEVWFQASMTSLHHNTHEVIVVAIDITKEKELQENMKSINKYLYSKVEEEVAKRMQVEEVRQKERAALIQSEKMAQLGNMLGAIIHQWKQPLSVISIVAQDIRESFRYDELTEEVVNKNIDEVLHQIEFMNKTADDFRNFYKPSKIAKDFSVKEETEDVLSLLSKELRLRNITSNITGGEGIMVYGYATEFKQVILNIVNNAKDAFEERKVEDANITTHIFKEESNAVITITDNAGGIPEALLPERLFEQFASTKGEHGTGIGLSICKTIIEENMGGNLTARNVEGGAEFKIVLPARRVS